MRKEFSGILAYRALLNKVAMQTKELLVSKHWLTGRFKKTFSNAIQFTGANLNKIGMLVLSDFLVKLQNGLDKQLDDIKGNAENQDRLVLISGELNNQEPFSISFFTKFSEYHKTSIRYDLITESSGIEPDELFELVLNHKAKISQIAITLEHLRDRALVPWLGSFPTVDESLVFQCSEETASIVIVSERLKSSASIPFYDSFVLSWISEQVEGLADFTT